MAGQAENDGGEHVRWEIIQALGQLLAVHRSGKHSETAVTDAAHKLWPLHCSWLARRSHRPGGGCCKQDISC